MNQHECTRHYCGRIGRGLVLVLCAGLGLVSTVSHAQLSGAGARQTAIDNGVEVAYTGAAGPAPTSGRVVTASAAGVTVQDTQAFGGPLGIVTGLVAARQIPWATVGRAVAGCLAAGPASGVGCATALTATAGAALWMNSQYRVRGAAGTDHPNDLGAPLGRDAGGPEVTIMNFCAATGNSYCRGSAHLAADAWLATQYQSGTGCGYGYCTTTTYTIGTPAASCPSYATAHNPWTCSGNFVSYTQHSYDQATGGAQYSQHVPQTFVNVNVSMAQQAVTQCDAVVDPFNSAYNVAAGAPLGFDGKCATGRYVATNESEIAAMVAAHSPAVDADIQKGLVAFNDWAHAGGPCAGCSPPSTDLTGPASVTGVGNVVTITDSTGTRVDTKTPIYPITYSPAVGLTGLPYGLIKWGNGSTTVSVFTPVGGGAPTTTTTTTGVTATGVTQSAAAARAEAVTTCDKYPNSAGCLVLGDPLTDVVPKGSHVLAFVDEAIGLPSGCPAPLGLPNGDELSYAPACSAATAIRPFVIMAGLVSALWICLGVTGAVGRKE